VSDGMTRLFERFTTLDLVNGEYCFINGYVEDKTLPRQGEYSRFARALLSRVSDEQEKREVADFISIEHLKSTLSKAEIVSLRVHAPDGSAEWFTYNFIVLERVEGTPARLLVVRQDVTALRRKEEEEQRRLADALDAAERANRAKTEFLFNMSHDLRTPMNAIIGYTELAEGEDVTREQMQGYVRKIDSSSQHLLALINDILEMSRIESGKLAIEPVRADLVRIMTEAQEMFAAQMKKKRIAFSVDTSGVRDRWVLCDSNRLNRVILNLISNAFKFTPENGRIDVRLAQTGGTAAEGRYALSVKDDGIGMSPDFVSKLFTPFERERTSTVSKTQGTGLGLSITKKIVDLMGGDIEVETEQGRGTEFTVSLSFPLVEAEDGGEVEAPLAAAPVDFSKVRLLLAEDNEINREIATMILSQSGFTIENVENGQIAVDMLAKSEPGYYDAVLMDIQMPVMDGYTAARTIRGLENPALASVPIIAMTANAFQEDVETARGVGMNGHIAKPLDVDKMLATLTEVLSKR
ncbi:MAG: response regulator, partial [Clostridia bacterium]|nr:response regulator [Clostridia bacterium]